MKLTFDASIPLIADRSRSTTDWSCARRRYLNYDFEGKGIVPVTAGYELDFGTVVHDSLAAIGTAEKAGEKPDIDGIAARAVAKLEEVLVKGGKPPEQQKEQLSLVEGLVRGFYRHVWPRILQQYPKILVVEQEMKYEYHGLTFLVKPDLVVVNKEGQAVYLEYKTTSSKKEEWVNSWGTAVQLHSTCRAIQATIGEEVGCVQVIGLYKGYSAYGKLSSPFVYAYRRDGTPPFSRTEVSYEYKGGFKRYPVWELEGGVRGWVDSMPENILADQFPITPPIFVNDDMVESFFAQRALRETEVQLAKEMLKMNEGDPELQRSILNTSFPQNFSECSPAWGHSCPYARVCFGSGANPLEQGFRVRVPHHQLEKDLLDA